MDWRLLDPEAGGQFEIVPDVRSADDENYERVGRILDGERQGVHSFSLEPGSLTIFCGHDSLHRVTRVAGAMNATIYGPRVA